MKFPVILTEDKNAGGFVVTFPDIPEAITQGESAAEALCMAQEALEAALEFYFEDKRQVPVPAEPDGEQHSVELPASLSAKVLLLNEMLRQHIRPAELARRLNTSPQEVNRLTNLRHSTRIDGIDAAWKCIWFDFTAAAESVLPDKVISILKQAENGVSVPDLCREHGISGCVARVACG